MFKERGMIVCYQLCLLINKLNNTVGQRGQNENKLKELLA